MISRLLNRSVTALRGVPTAASPLPPSPSPPSLVVAERPGRLVSVAGPLDAPGTAQLEAQLMVVLTEGTAFLGLDLSRVTECGTELFAVLARVHARLRERAVWMRLLGVSPGVLAALQDAPIPHILTVYLTSDRTPRGAGADDTVPADAAGVGTEGAAPRRPLSHRLASPLRHATVPR